jgi:hypothetical protein
MMSEHPALRISNIVYGRQAVGNKVKYFVEPHRDGTEKAVPETVVLKRWRCRQLEGYKFSGTRLSSTLWRAIHSAFPKDPRTICGLDLNAIEIIIERKRVELARHYYRLPNADALHALLFVLGPDRLASLVIRHTAPTYAGHSGVPDLFLYAIKQGTEVPCMHRFVEVKKPGEPVSDDQKAELRFLKDLGLKARVLRLLERK